MRWTTSASNIGTSKTSAPCCIPFTPAVREGICGVVAGALGAARAARAARAEKSAGAVGPSMSSVERVSCGPC